MRLCGQPGSFHKAIWLLLVLSLPEDIFTTQESSFSEPPHHISSKQPSKCRATFPSMSLPTPVSPGEALLASMDGTTTRPRPGVSQDRYLVKPQCQNPIHEKETRLTITKGHAQPRSKEYVPSIEEEHDASSSIICNDVTVTTRTSVPTPPATTLTLPTHLTHNTSTSRYL